MPVFERIKQKIEVLKKLDQGFEVFGSESHRYQLYRCLSEAEIVAFEKQHNVVLPEDYRNFLLKVGNGGPGPGYGLLPLYKTEFLDDPTQPFPFSTPIFDWDEIEPELQYVESGALTILTFGCSFDALLIVTGKDRGKVWLVGETYCVPTKNYSSDNRPCDFLPWYEMWLDVCIYSLRNREKHHRMFSYGNPIDKP